MDKLLDCNEMAVSLSSRSTVGDDVTPIGSACSWRLPVIEPGDTPSC